MKHLIFDVGLHLGEDTAFYLALGHDVIAFEANPKLVEHCGERFAHEIESGRLTIVSGAITENAAETAAFYLNERSVWGTSQEAWAERNAKLGSLSTEITVPAINFQECLERYGTPHYIKIDVEGVDRFVVGTVCSLQNPPPYLSMETEKVDFDLLSHDIRTLENAGYRWFKVVQQRTVPQSKVCVTRADGVRLAYQFEHHASGVFGEDLKGPWLTSEEAIALYKRIFRWYRLMGDATVWARYGQKVIVRVERLLHVGLPGWHDLHAKLG